MSPRAEARPYISTERSPAGQGLRMVSALHINRNRQPQPPQSDTCSVVRYVGGRHRQMKLCWFPNVARYASVVWVRSKLRREGDALTPAQNYDRPTPHLGNRLIPVG
jgi:hypothetical protein